METPSQPRSHRPKSRQSIAYVPDAESMSNDKENGTVDVSSLHRRKDSSMHGQKKKSRSKSLGPGVFEALMENNGNAIKTSIVVPKSILKPTVPITPPKAIPTFEASRRKTPGNQNKKSPGKGAAEDLLIDFSTPAPSASAGGIAGSENLVDPFSPLRHKSPARIATPSQVESTEDVAAREREAEEKRQAEKKLIMEQRAARRKSMANRRVSFAPEATLHTWNVVELAEDSTTSSASNSTRRQSSMTAQQSPGPSSHPPSTPTSQPEETLVEASPAHQRDLHQKKRRRRSSGIPPMNFNNPDDDVDFSSSPFSGSSVGEGSSPVAIDDSIHSDESDDDETAMCIDDVTAQSGISVGSSTGSSLDERLAAAAGQAGTRGIDYDEAGDDLSMELATGTVTNAFQPWVKSASNAAQNLSSRQDQENVNPFSPAFKAQVVANTHQATQETDDETQDMTMDMTAAIGGIVQQKRQSPAKGRRKSVANSRRRSSAARRRSSGGESTMEDETMDLTTMGGGIIRQQAEETEEDAVSDEDEEMTMEFTNVVGGVLAKPQASATNETLRPDFEEPSTMDETMDMTAAFGTILAPIEERTENSMMDDDETQAMDVTKAIGAILPPHLNSASKARAKQLMEEEAEAGQLHEASPRSYAATASSSKPSPTKAKSAVPDRVSTSIASETGSPSMALKPRLSGRRTPAAQQSTTPKATSVGTPTKASLAKAATPTKQMTPKPVRPETPEKTPIMANVIYRSASPRKLFKQEIKAKHSPASAQKSAQKSHKKGSLFSHNTETGMQTPSVVLAPKHLDPKAHQHFRRRSSGLGIDKEGVGSPRVSVLLDRRQSIAEDANMFAPDPFANRGGVRFDDPKELGEQVDADREEEVRRESGRFVMEQEADGHQDDENATMNLKEMIQSMTPRKNKLKGRKSLAPGGARGLLGKRPVELDSDEEGAAETTPKRLKVVENQASPVKKIHLPAPPSKDETTGRVTRAKRKSLEETTANITPRLRMSPAKTTAAVTPKAQGRFKEAVLEPTSTRPTSFEDKLDNVMGAIDASVVQAQQEEAEEIVEEKIHLQDFLNMTNIHFMELNTTKRRQTVAPGDAYLASVAGQTNTATFPECVVAATTTLPLLEMYQHACRELKAYISSGRKIIRSIEQETLDDQPALFREYLDARPDVKMVMDNQFRNGKVNARLESKAGWYAWRSQLVDGLKGGLESIKAGMADDEGEIYTQKEMLDAVLPGLEEKSQELEDEEQNLLKRKEDLESEDHEALRDARSRLAKLEAEMNRKKNLLNNLQHEMQEKDSMLADAAELKDEFQSQIQEAERVQEECRGLSLKDVKSARDTVQEIERSTNWKIVSAEEDEDYSEANGPAVTMTYKDCLRLFFYPAAFQTPPHNRRSSRSRASTPPPSSAPISLTYSPAESGEVNGTNLSTVKRFMLQFLRSQLHALALQPRGTVTPLMLLNYVKSGWDLTTSITEEIRQLRIMGVTNVAILGDETLGAKCTVILSGGKGRVDMSFKAIVKAEDGEIKAGLDIDVKPAYGANVTSLLEKKRDKVLEALKKEAEGKEMGEGSWGRAVAGFEEWCGAAMKSEKTGMATPGKGGRTPRRR